MQPVFQPSENFERTGTLAVVRELPVRKTINAKQFNQLSAVQGGKQSPWTEYVESEKATLECEGLLCSLHREAQRPNDFSIIGISRRYGVENLLETDEAQLLQVERTLKAITEDERMVSSKSVSGLVETIVDRLNHDGVSAPLIEEIASKVKYATTVDRVLELASRAMYNQLALLSRPRQFVKDQIDETDKATQPLAAAATLRSTSRWTSNCSYPCIAFFGHRL